MPKKSRKLYFYTIEANGIAPINFNFQRMLNERLNESPSVRSTIIDPDGKCKCIGFRYPLDEYIGLRLLAFERGRAEEAFRYNDTTNERVDTIAVPPPDDDGEFVSGTAYAFVKSNNLILSFSQSFKESTIQDYFTKFIFGAYANNTRFFALHKGITNKARDALREIKEIKIFTNAQFDTDGTRFIPEGFNRIVAHGVTSTATDLSVNSLANPKNIQMYAGYKFNQTRRSGQGGFDEFVNKILCNIDADLIWQAETKNKILRSHEVILTKKISVATTDTGIIQDTDMILKMKDWYNNLCDSGEIV